MTLCLRTHRVPASAWQGEWGEAEQLHRAFLAKYPGSPYEEEFLTVRLPAIAERRVAAAH